MNLRALAEQDLKHTLESTSFGSAQNIVLCSPSGTEYELNAIVDDIGYLLDTDGNPIAGRSISVSIRMASLMSDNGTYIEPGRGWTCRYVDLSEKDWNLYVVRFAPDRSVGIGVMYLSLELGR